MFCDIEVEFGFKENFSELFWRIQNKVKILLPIFEAFICRH